MGELPLEEEAPDMGQDRESIVEGQRRGAAKPQ